MTAREPDDANQTMSDRTDAEKRTSDKREAREPAVAPLYRRLARKEARVREDQYVALSQLVRVLARRRTNRSGARLTENTLIRVAIDLLLSRANHLAGNNERELRASVLDTLTASSIDADRQGDNR